MYDNLNREQVVRQERRRTEALRFGIIAMCFVLAATCYFYGSLVQLSVLSQVYSDTSLSMTVRGLDANQHPLHESNDTHCQGTFDCAARMCRLWEKPNVKLLLAEPDRYLTLKTCNVSAVQWHMNTVLRDSNYSTALILCTVVMALLALNVVGYLVLCACAITGPFGRPPRRCATWIGILMFSQLAISVLLVVTLIAFFGVQDPFLNALPHIFITTSALTHTLAVMMALCMNTFAQCYVCAVMC